MEKGIEVVGILGYGEIGSSIERICEKKYRVTVQDPKLGKKFSENFQVMHVCIRIPEPEKFVDIVSEAILQYKPKLTIIESTLPIGTTRKIAEKTKAAVVHSPCRGVHPNLAEGILTFEKFVGAVEKKDAEKAARYYNSLGIKTEVFDSPEDTEAAKILSTTYYMANVIFCKEVAKLCKEHNLNFEQVYSISNETYNKGYGKLGMKHVRRPVLNAMPGKVGGHCLRPNLDMLNKFTDKKYFKMFEELDESY
ncbi:MAG: hypothetical protein ABIB71_02405 [Candidatus Woesearchaeota archaeon]